MTTITIDRATVEQALEALESVQPQNMGPLIHPAKQALRAALAQQVEPVLQTCNCRWDGEVQVQQCTLHEAHIDAIHEWAERAKVAERKLAQQAEPDDPERRCGGPGCDLTCCQPVQEPYCYVYEYDGVFGMHREFYPKTYNGQKPSRTVPVYTAPPQRKPLTREEIAAEWRKASECAGKSEGAVTTSQFVEMFARAVERAHGIGEGA